MNSLRYTFLTLLISIIHYLVTVDSISKFPIVVVLAIDGFPTNDKGVTPFISGLKKVATTSEYMFNIFPPEYMPNYYSAVTGVYPKSHGIISTDYYDHILGNFYGYNRDLFQFSEKFLPIWIINELEGNGRHSGVMHWPGGEYDYVGITPTYKQYAQMALFNKIDLAVKWLLDDEKPANMIFIHLDNLQQNLQNVFKIYDSYVKTLVELDQVTERLFAQLDYHGIRKNVNVFIFSHSGLVDATKATSITMVNTIGIHEGDNAMSSSLTTFFIYAKGNLTEYRRMLKERSAGGTKYDFYFKGETPKQWHLGESERFPTIYVVAKPKYIFEDYFKRYKTIVKPQYFKISGYFDNNPETKAFFLATGPHIVPNYKIEPFQIIDLFTLWAFLGQFPRYSDKVNGDFLNVIKMLRQPPKISDNHNSHGLKLKPKIYQFSSLLLIIATFFYPVIAIY